MDKPKLNIILSINSILFFFGMIAQLNMYPGINRIKVDIKIIFKMLNIILFHFTSKFCINVVLYN